MNDSPTIVRELRIRIEQLKDQRFHANAEFDEKRVKEITERIEAIEAFIKSIFGNG